MKIEKEVITTEKFVAFDGEVFNNKENAREYEISCLESNFSKLHKGTKFVLIRFYSNGTSFAKFNLGKRKCPNDYYIAGDTSNIKYSKKFNSVREIYDVFEQSQTYTIPLDFDGKQKRYGVYRIITQAKAEEISKRNLEIADAVKSRTQPYLKVFNAEHEPTLPGEYITDLGMAEYFDGAWCTPHKPTFWMRKVSKTNL